MLQHVIPLELLSAGEEAVVLEIDGRNELVIRLAEMGIREGAAIRMVSPGCPCIIAVDNHRFSIRTEAAATVMVQTLEPA